MEDRLGLDRGKIFEKTGIRERRVAAPHEATSDLAAHAARQALAAAGMQARDIDLIVLATSTPDQPMPATACHVQASIGATRAFAFDIQAVCTGFIYALKCADSLLAADPDYSTALVIGADTYSRILDYTDYRTSTLFGDGAGAVVLGKVPDGQGLLASTLYSDGRNKDLIQIPGGGSRIPPSHLSIEKHQHYFMMNGREVRRLATEKLAAVVTELCTTVGITLPDVDLIVSHQANGVMLADLAENLGLASGMLHLTVGKYGNTGAASVPITLDDAVRASRLQRDSLLLIVAFGGGATWGGVALRWA
ncbi:3-oxoacyl-(acyl-carrier-protein) synthase III [Frankia sp. CeD]|jgi:3-oxoacyl-[acyl-carrier-protein] synthase-3|uniref:3-oxoacyl-[acyl-carrier-protein] synthase III n=2 Tax=Frankiaceae TaxID=74712 RepID=Q2JEB9_FRACC|nr:3-oxoacyl-[acyl-carrier-protein] synthase III [Frankia casuarinae]KDA41968.1 3-oxoacyl-(acyl-carrier-protein) synthase III [Frankia sp. BMG5.23]KEZ38277.1 3-oxoacyl-(acyl-carrier-protein) synthase III [Frankia sp. CeD]